MYSKALTHELAALDLFSKAYVAMPAKSHLLHHVTIQLGQPICQLFARFVGSCQHKHIANKCVLIETL